MFVGICGTLVLIYAAEYADILRICFPRRNTANRYIYFLHASQPWLQVDAHEAQEHVEQPQDGHLDPHVQAPVAQVQFESQGQAMMVLHGRVLGSRSRGCAGATRRNRKFIKKSVSYPCARAPQTQNFRFGRFYAFVFVDWGEMTWHHVSVVNFPGVLLSAPINLL
jgi:hypothetical protein